MQAHTAPAPLIEFLVPAHRGSFRLARDIALVLGFSLLIALGARIAVPLGFTPVPVTGQTLAVLLGGAVLGSRRGAAAAFLYLLEGMWLPLFAGGNSGLVWHMASGGYIIGFVPAAYVVGFLCERGWDRKPWVLTAMLIGNILIYIPGLLQLGFFVPREKVLEYGLYPFIPGDLVKIYVASLLLPAAWAAARRWRGDDAAWK